MADQQSAEAKISGAALPFVIIGGCAIGLFALWILYQMFTTAMTWAWNSTAWLFWHTVGLPFWWLSNYSEKTPALPCTPMGLLTCFLLICVLCIKKDDAEESFIKMGIAYVVVAIMGFLASF